MRNKYLKNTALYVAVIALYVALTTGGKQALAVVPNVEVVTLLLAVCSFVWGARVGVPAAVVFCLVQTVFYGFSTWVLSYFVHWPMVAVTFALFGKIKWRNKWIKLVAVTSVAVVATAIFGVVTSAVDTLLTYSANSGLGMYATDFWRRLGVMYARGVVFYAIHVASNAVMFAVAFLPLEKANRMAQLRMFGDGRVSPTN